MLARGLSTTSGDGRATEDEVIWKPKSFINSFGLLLAEQKRNWPWYLLLCLGCAGAGAGYPIQAYLFAQLLNVVQFSGAELQIKQIIGR